MLCGGALGSGWVRVCWGLVECVVEASVEVGGGWQLG